MEYRNLGRTGLKVSELCLGAMTFGRETSEEDSFKLLDAFAEAGGNFIDTANVYSRGISETILGKWLANQRREDFVIATKVRFPMGDKPNDVGLGRKHIMAAIEDSLDRLQTDYIDLYQIHCWDNATPLRETLSTLNNLVESGAVRYIGVSNYKAYQIQKAVDLCKAMNWHPFVSLQPLYNLLDRYIEWDLVEVCDKEGIGIIPWSPLRGGWLTGKFQRGMEKPPQDTRIAIASEQGWSESWDQYANERTWSIIDTLMQVAEAEGKSPVQIALNWVKDRPGVTAPIIGARNMNQLTSNLGSVGWTMSEENRKTLDEVSDQPPPIYPHGFINRANADR